MIAAMAAAVSPASTLRLVSGAVGLSGKLTLGAEAGPLEARGAGTGVVGCAAGPLGHGLGQSGRRADDCLDGHVGHRRALAAYRVGPKCRQPQKNEYRPAPHRAIQAQAGRTRKLCRRRDTRSRSIKSKQNTHQR
jgi:hypothetical protein